MVSLSHLAEKKDYERTIKIYRRHWIALFLHIVAFAIEIVLPIVVVRTLLPSFPGLLTHPIAEPLFVLLGSCYALGIWLLFFHNFLDYYLDTWIVTNERLVHVEQKGFFSRMIVELRFYRVQDVTSEAHGILATFFGYGTIAVQTAGASTHFVMKQIPHAHAVASQLLKLVEDDRPYHTAKAHEETN